MKHDHQPHGRQQAHQRQLLLGISFPPLRGTPKTSEQSDMPILITLMHASRRPVAPSPRSCPLNIAAPPPQNRHTSSHDRALALVLLPYLASRDAVPLARAPRILAQPLELLEPASRLGIVLGCTHAHVSQRRPTRTNAQQQNLPAALQYHLLASSKLAGTPMPSSVK